MGKIELKRGNVVKRVDSEDRAKALEAKGFVRTDGKTVREAGTDVDKVVSELQRRLAEASKVMEKADEAKGKVEAELAEAKAKAEAAEKELESVKAQLQETEKKAQALETELEGTKEQLEAAVKQNKAAGKK